MDQMANVGQARETLEDLYRTPGKAELIDGRIVHYMPTGHRPNQVAFAIAISLRGYARQTGRGVACTDNMGFAVPELPSGRESFCPDAAYYTGVLPANSMRFVEGAPALAVEVRSENDYGPAAEADLAAKRDDYFAAGTAVVWDVDPVAECIHVYRSGDPVHPTTYHRGQLAEAEPAAPGWQIAVDEVFES
jgi:Uma2 family endonuclease